VSRVTVFGAGAMGTALAMHAARRGIDVALWANPYDSRALQAIRRDGRHPALPEHVPASLAVYGPDELDAATDGCEIAVLAANSAGARSLAAMVREAFDGVRFIVSLAKGLESDSLKRVSQVYAEVLDGNAVIAVGGPCLAAELAQGAPSAAVWSAGAVDDAREAGTAFEDRHYQLQYTDDLAGLEFCTTGKNVTAIGMGILDGLARLTDERFRNAQAALFTRAVRELGAFVEAMGGRAETALGLAGLGDLLVTSLGGRNRLYGERVGEGADPKAALEEMVARGLTVEGVDSTRDVHVLSEEKGLDLPYHRAVYRVLFDGDDPRTVMETLC
jgi:glycerol-3-phosphate dehydrogenase (NAD(P)+)